MKIQIIYTFNNGEQATSGPISPSEVPDNWLKETIYGKLNNSLLLSNDQHQVFSGEIASVEIKFLEQ